MPKRITSLSEIKASKLALFGAGSFGKFVYQNIKNETPHLEAICFIDDVKKGEFCGLPILSLKDFLPKINEIEILVTSSYSETISNLISKYTDSFYIADILNEERTSKIFKKTTSLGTFDFYVPNRFLYEVANNVEGIEPETTKWINGINDSVFYDIGASSGVYGLLAGKKNNKIISFEPDALNFAIMKRNLFLNRSHLIAEYIPLNLALNSHKQIIKLNMLEFGEGFHGRFTSNSERSNDKTLYTENIMAYDLDSVIGDFDLPTPTHIKIDVDGAEANVLSGMKTTLTSPILREILIETSTSEEENIKLILQNFGFTAFEKHKINEITGSEVFGVHNLLFKRQQ